MTLKSSVLQKANEQGNVAEIPEHIAAAHVDFMVLESQSQLNAPHPIPVSNMDGKLYKPNSIAVKN